MLELPPLVVGPRQQQHHHDVDVSERCCPTACSRELLARRSREPNECEAPDAQSFQRAADTAAETRRLQASSSSSSFSGFAILEDRIAMLPECL